MFRAMLRRDAYTKRIYSRCQEGDVFTQLNEKCEQSHRFDQEALLSTTKRNVYDYYYESM